MREVICGVLNGHKVVVDKLTGEASLLADDIGNPVLTYINVLEPIDHSKDEVCQRLAKSWGVDGVIMSTQYFVKLSGNTAQYFKIDNMAEPYLSTPFELEVLEG